ncbi:hypothetical protein GCM10023116_28010 [Kistimonas scapharcae]|uniref:Uncharacterized protein n=1 Tax=Kistimonas scapharcae TaxID=1036133 RepID=A0ABP8V2R2_9GAMM
MGNGYYLSTHEAVIPGLCDELLSHRLDHENTDASRQDELEKSMRRFDEIYEAVMRKHNWRPAVDA